MTDTIRTLFARLDVGKLVRFSVSLHSLSPRPFRISLNPPSNMLTLRTTAQMILALDREEMALQEAPLALPLPANPPPAHH
jgi:hypothetical protein